MSTQPGPAASPGGLRCCHRPRLGCTRWTRRAAEALRHCGGWVSPAILCEFSLLCRAGVGRFCSDLRFVRSRALYTSIYGLSSVRFCRDASSSSCAATSPPVVRHRVPARVREIVVEADWSTAGSLSNRRDRETVHCRANWQRAIFWRRGAVGTALLALGVWRARAQRGAPDRGLGTDRSAGG